MNEVLMLADLDNVHWFDLGQASLAARIKVVVGQMQSKLSTALVQQAQALGSRLEWVRIDGNGRNALDFHIACHLGEGICRFPRAEFTIVSNDKVFDPIIRHLVTRGFKYRRDGQAVLALRPSRSCRHTHRRWRNCCGALTRTGGRESARRSRITSRRTSTTASEEIKKTGEYLLDAELIAGAQAVLTFNY
jgi:hypothetical protein